MGGTAVSWRSWKLGEVSRSTTEAEYCAASDAAAEAKRLVNLLVKLNYKPDLPVKIFTDNRGGNHTLLAHGKDTVDMRENL